ncbi:hypothetical protein FNL37_0553 [Methylovorus glucosotrophus]|uniref:hypothetical protein n=1 Tax=Methylovorus glucosotrophus TaxID=266009 RepID=UPI00133171B0|nr:hypothetical protein [Methylovorus glucosotrophus]KAF0843135.1 hypothetical protein FNL37_0553 [Methylovorus glucosotrophus]
MNSEINESDNLKERQAALIKAIKDGTVSLLDGVMSPVSRSIANRLGTAQFDMNSWWVETPTKWECPACGRSKLEIARLNANGEIMCHLVEHHDHMRDVLKRRFREISINREDVIADEQAEGFAKRSSMMIASFENTIVCVDCNNADTIAKKVAKAHSDFSFSPQELRQIIKPVSNRSHNIDREAAKALWRERERTFELRLRIADRIAQIAANNEHWFQPGGWGSTSESVSRTASDIIFRWGAYGVQQELKGPRKIIPSRSISAWRHTQYPAIKETPHKNEIEHAGVVGNPRFWAELNEEWKCPGCQRKKRELVRKNKDGEWSFPVGKRFLFNTAAPRCRVDTLACGDCIKVAEDMGKEAAFIAGKKIQGFASKVSIDEVQRCVIPRAHSRHNIKNEVIEEILEIIARRIISTTD